VAWEASRSINIAPISLLVLQATSFCNIDCTYCYVPHRNKGKVMSPDVLSWALRRTFGSGLLGPRIDVLWHAGEPLVVGQDFFRHASELTHGLNATGTKVQQCIQTNATLVDEQWCELFKSQSYDIGVSLDGPREVHDAHRVTRAGHGTFLNTMRGIEILRANGIDVSILSVLTRESLIKHREVLDFFEENSLTRLGFSLEEMDHTNRDWSFRSKEEAVTLFREFAEDALVRHRSRRLKIREIEQIEERMRPGGSRAIHPVPLHFVTVDVDGGFSTFCPQLHKIKYPDGNHHVFGNVMENEFVDIFANEHFLRVYESVMGGIKRCAESCRRFGLCGSHQVAVKYLENGTFESTETVYCKARIKVVADVLEKAACAQGLPL
jgi:uncharacterized protein